MAICSVADLPITEMLNWKRAGVIPYRVTPSGIEFALGVDRATGEVSNFAGTFKKSDVTIINTAKREFDEETHGVFGRIDDRTLKDFVAIYSTAEDSENYDARHSATGELIIFYPCNYKKEEVIFSFEKRRKPNSEMKNIIFYSSNELIELLSGVFPGKVIYSRVRELLLKAIQNDGIFFS